MTDHRVYNLADPTDFEAFAATYGRATAKAFKFQLAYCVRSTGKGFAKASSVDKLAGLSMAELEKRAVALVNPNPYYNLSMCRRSLTVVQLAIAAIEGGYRPVECFNHAVDGGIVFG